MAASRLVEVASHSHSLHKGTRSNPQGSLPSAAITYIYNPNNRHYENDAEYTNRLRADLAKNSDLIAKETGKKPRVMIWPYGAYNMLAVKAAEAEGMPIAMTLEPGANTPSHPLSRIRRDMLFFNDKVSDLQRNLRQQDRYDGEDQPMSRIVGIDLDSLYDPNPAKQELKLGELIERILRLRINTIYLRAVTDLDHDGFADAAYFPNRHLPVRADLFNRVVWQLQTRASVASVALYVYAWLPITAFELPSGQPINHQAITEIYDDAGKNAPRIGGLALGFDTELKSYEEHNLIPFTQELIATFKLHQPYAFYSRIIPGTALMTKERKLTNLANLHKYYDFVTLTLADLDGLKDDANQLMKIYTDSVREIPGGLNSTAFLLPVRATPEHQPDDKLAHQLQVLQQHGARNFGYYPDVAALDYPAISVIKPVISLHTNPGL
jgi:biofilm PGA synthesis lipoprotein PgaB